jgi:hypothetical protein
MGTTLYAGAARRTINPQLGTGMAGLRLFGSPIQAIETDLTATVLVLGDGDSKVALIGVDLCVTSIAEAGRLRAAVADALGTPVSHVLLNLSHVHSSPALPEFMAMTDSAEDEPFRERTCSAGSSRLRWRRTAGCSRPGSVVVGARARLASTGGRSATGATCSARCPTIRSTPRSG